MISLKNLLKNSIYGRDLIKRLNKLRKIARIKLKEIQNLFPEYTKHDIEHCENLIKILNLIIPDNLITALNENEIYFLLCSAYLHDIGMCLLKEELDDKFLDQFEDDQEKLKDYIRNNHHLRSEEYIKQNYQKLFIENHHQAAIIGELCRGHRNINLSHYDTDFIYNHDSINIALLAIFLRIADELDIAYDRIPMIDGKLILPEDRVSRKLWEAHLSVSGVSIDKKDPLVVKCSARCKDPRIHRTLKRLESKINAQIYEIPSFIGQYHQYITDLPRYCRMNIISSGYEPIDLKFTIENRIILNYIIDQLYKDNSVAIRELIKNSIDSCRAKRQICIKEDRIYTPSIKITLSNDKKEIIIEDNGIGMDIHIIHNYLTKVGKSFYKSREFIELDLDFTPISELGLGMLSYFLICDKFLIDTKSDDNTSIIIEINDVDDYFIIRKGKKKDSGTTVTLKLKEEITKRIDTSFSSTYARYRSGEEPIFYYRQLYLNEIVRKYARHVEIPIDLIFNIFHESINDIGYKLDFISKDYFYYSIEVNKDFAQGIIVIPQKNPESRLKAVPFSEYKPPLFNYTVSYEGIYVGEVQFAFGKISPRIIKYDLNLKNNAIVLNISRDGVLYGEKFFELSKKIETIVLEKVPKILEGYIEYLEGKNIDHKQYIYNFINEYFIYPEDNTHKDVIKKYYYFKIIKDKQIEYLNYNEIMKFKGKLAILKGAESLSDKILKEKIDHWENCDNSLIMIVRSNKNPPLETYFEDLPVIKYPDENLKK